LALITSLALAAQLYLRNSPSEVVGAGAFLLFMWVGIPAIALFIWAVVHSFKASDRRLLYLTALLIVLICAAMFEAPLVLVTALEVLYIVLGLSLSFVWWSGRDRTRTD
jgi:hypothetical protein